MTEQDAMRSVPSGDSRRGTTARPAAPASFAARPASKSWEQICFADCPQNYAWVWFKPSAVRHGVVFRIPQELYEAHPEHAAQWTLRKLLTAAGVEPRTVSMWQLCGVAYQGMEGANPYMDAAIPKPPDGVDPNILVCVNTTQAAAEQAPASYGDESSLAEMFDRIQADWQAALDIEKELGRQRKRLLEMLKRLNTLNRDLTPDERRHANNQDKRDWTDARRWLRDAGTRVWRCIKEYDIGDTSSAGHRTWFERTYQQFVVRRRPFDGILQAQREFENYRKTLLTLQTTMNNAYANAENNAERRAQRVLDRIAAKIRDAKTKKNFLGVVCD